MRNSILTIFFLFLVKLSFSQSAFYFQSGFEGGTVLRQYELNGNVNSNYADIYGNDNGYDWVLNLDNDPNVGSFRIYYEVGDTMKANASLVNDPLNSTNQVLKFALDSSNVPNNGSPKGRVQAAISGNINLKEFSFKVKLYIHPDIDTLRYYNSNITWFTLNEFWNNSPALTFPFRVTLNIQKPDPTVGSNLYFGAHGETRDTSFSQGVWDSVWEEIDTTYAVPVGQWLTFETYFFEGDSLNGKYRVVVTDSLNNSHTLFDVTNFTHHPNDTLPDGVTNFNPMKLYTSGLLIENMAAINAELAVFWDDFEFWKDTNTLSLIKHDMGFSKMPLYPNPFSDIIYLEGGLLFSKINIYNSTGSLVKVIDKQCTSISFQNLSKGIYLIEILEKDRSRKTYRIVKE